MNFKDDIGIQVRPLKPKPINEAHKEALEVEICIREKLKCKFQINIRNL